MLKSLKANDVNGHLSFDLRFHEDMNVVTGKNGSGKTTVLKLLWYAISGNLERILSEIEFRDFELQTDRVFLAIRRDRGAKVELVFRVDGIERISDCPIERIGRWVELAEANRHISRATGASVFFPTFRRIEGGFSTTPAQEERDYSVGSLRPRSVYESRSTVRHAMNQLSERVSVGEHLFVVSTSTEDLRRLMTSKYTQVSERNNRLHMELSQFILQRVGGNQPSPVTTLEMEATLNEIRERAERVTHKSEDLMRPFSVLSGLIAKIFQHRGIRLDGPLTLGQAQDAIDSEILSAGEKQMLSFLCYNAFAQQACIFIDEPEISLHVDWQRILFPILLEQSTGNQFIVATHSPFIYSKYSDKELLLSADRGEDNAYAPDDRDGDHRLSRENELADIAG